MGSTTPSPPLVETLHDQRRRFSAQQQNPEVESQLSNRELRELLERKDLEIRYLKLEIEKYKLALKSCSSSQVGNNEVERLSHSSRVVNDTIESLLSPAAENRPILDDAGETVARFETSLSKDSSSQIRDVSTLDETIFRTSNNDEENDKGSDKETVSSELILTSKPVHISDKTKEQQTGLTVELQEIAQDVEEIDLNLELNKNRKKRLKQRKAIQDLEDQIGEIECDKDDGKKQRDNENLNDERDNDDDDDEDDDIITEGLLTSLTDAAINNLSQLAALQERCESQQHSQQESLSHEEFQTTASNAKPSQTISGSNVFSQQSTSTLLSESHVAASTADTPSSCSRAHHDLLSQCHLQMQSAERRASFDIQDPFSDSNLANQAALALSAIGGHSPLIAQPINSSPSTVSPSPTAIQTSQDLSSNQSLASVVAAAAAAAAEAAAVGEQPRHQHPPKQHHHHLPPNQQHHHHAHSQSSRLTSSNIASPDYYQNLHHQQTSGLVHQISSPISALHFSPSITSPSPSSLIGAPSHHTRRPASNNSSSILSPIASPNYLRRQFIPLMSPSPTTSLVTVGSSSGIGSAAGSAHMLHLAHQQNHHHRHSSTQQRSASALAGHITTPSSSSQAPLSSGAASTAVSPLMSSKNSSQARLNNMQIRHKFGYLGSGRGQFNSPHGFCLGLNQEIVVADTNNHRVCIFDKDGTYVTQFGSPGKEEGQLWNPRKVAILHRPISGGGSATSGPNGSSTAHQRNGATSVSTFSSNFTSGGGIQSTGSSSSGNHFASEPLYVVCDRGAERSRMQLFTKDGAFIKKIGIHYIDIVAGLAITQNGLIIVVDSVSPTVYIINAESGTLNGWFDCSGHMKEPSDIAVKSDIPGVEYFICDFKGHCVVVFSEQGDYLRKIGHDGLTSYPNGIDISDDGDILVGDSHGNRFHVVVFDRNGNFVSQFECPHVKVSRCCGLKITREGYIVTLAKNNHHVLVLDTIHI